MDLRKKVLFCACANAGVLPKETRESALASLEGAGCGVTVVPDLCRLAAERDPSLQSLAGDDGWTVAACFPRAVKWLLERSGVDADRVTYLDLRADGAGAVLAEIGGAAARDGHELPGPEAAEWQPWFPILDYDRCTGCGQCMNFCLFGVYTRAEDEKVEVTHPAQCKNLCPACARICPEAAIIFPKANESPINGEDISDEEAVKANIKVNVDRILGDDVYAALRERKKKRRALLNKNRLARALAERKKHVAEVEKPVEEEE